MGGEKSLGFVFFSFSLLRLICWRAIAHIWKAGIACEFAFANPELSLGNVNAWNTFCSHKENSLTLWIPLVNIILKKDSIISSESFPSFIPQSEFLLSSLEKIKEESERKSQRVHPFKVPNVPSEPLGGINTHSQPQWLEAALFRPQPQDQWCC